MTDSDSDDIYEVFYYKHLTSGYTYEFGELLINADSGDRYKDAANLMYHVPVVRGFFQNLGANIPRVPAQVQVPLVGGQYLNGYLKFGTQNGYHWARTSDIIYHEYTHAIIHDFYGGRPGSDNSEPRAIDEGISDYFACSITNSSSFGESVGLNRDLDNSLSYDSGHDQWWNGQVIGGACWDLRSLIGATVVDQLVYEALQDQPTTFESFANAVKQADHDLYGSIYQDEIVQSFANHSINVSIPNAPTITFDSGWNENAVVSWTSTGADHYVLKKEYNFGTGWGTPQFIDPVVSPYTDAFIRDKFGSEQARYSVYSVDNLDYISDYSNTLNTDGTSTWKRGSENVIETDLHFELSGNYPNPFNPITNIHFQLPEASRVIVKVYNVLGKEVGKVVNKDFNKGNHILEFNGTNLSSGIYIYSISTISLEGTGNTYFDIKKMQLIK